MLGVGCREREGKRERGGGIDRARENMERGRVQDSEREEGERERVYASGWLTELVEPSGTFALSITVVVFALQLGYVEACFRV